MAKRTTQFLRLVLDSKNAAAEHAAAQRLAEIEGLSVSAMLRRLLKSLYRRKINGYDPALFAGLHPGGNDGHSPECACIVCQPKSKKGEKTDE